MEYLDVINNQYLVLSEGGDSFGSSYIKIYKYSDNSNFECVFDGFSGQVGDEFEEDKDISFGYKNSKIYFWVYTTSTFGEEYRGAIKYEATIQNDNLINITPIKRITKTLGEE